MDKKTFSRKELYELVWQTPFTILSKKYNISDNGLRKTCVRMNIPYPKAGHWQKLKFGKKSDKKRLPTDIGVQQEVILSLRNADQPNQPIDGSSQLQRLQSEIEIAIGRHLVIPEELEQPNELVLALKKCLAKQEPDKWNYIGMVNSTDMILDTKVNERTIGRALIFWNALINALRARGHDVLIRYSNTYIIVDGSEFKVFMREKSTKEIYREHNWDSTRYKASGILSLQWYSYPQKEWKDGKSLRLEQQLSRIIAYFEIEADREKAERLVRQRREDERKELERLHAEQVKREKDELIAFKDMLHKASRWHQANNLRNYIAEVENRAASNGETDESLNSWLKWANEKADWYDPFVEREDDLLADVDRDSLNDAEEVQVNKKPYPYYGPDSGQSYFASQWKNNYPKNR